MFNYFNLSTHFESIRLSGKWNSIDGTKYHALGAFHTW